MYTAFYNLKTKPFELTASPRFLYLGDVHKEALAFLTYGIVERRGFVLLTGDVGTGKTTVLKALLFTLDHHVKYVHIANPPRSGDEFIDHLSLSVFNKNLHFKSRPAFLMALEKTLMRYCQKQQTFVLIIDEAQNLSFEVLEEIRLLSNMETNDGKLVNIVLVGQPELNEKLHTTRCRALLQRIGIRYHITPLGLRDTRAYVATRLKVAGCENGQQIFPNRTIKTIYKFSKGYPRVINVLADNALLLGYTLEKKTISPGMIKKVLQTSDFGRAQRGKKFGGGNSKGMKTQRNLFASVSWKWAVASLAILVFVLFMVKTGEEFQTVRVDSDTVRNQPAYEKLTEDDLFGGPSNEVTQKTGIPIFRGTIGQQTLSNLKKDNESDGYIH